MSPRTWDWIIGMIAAVFLSFTLGVFFGAELTHSDHEDITQECVLKNSVWVCHGR